MIKPVQLAHLVLRTSRYQEMLDWYKQVLNATVTFGNEVLSFVTYDEEHHRVAFINIPDLKDSPLGTAGMDHIAFTYATLSDLLENYKRLKGKGITPFWCINHGPTTSMYYRDPDKNQIELQVENFATVAESTAFFYSDEFRENPIGVDFTPEDLMSRLANGEPEEAVKRRPNIGPRTFSDGVPLG